MKKICHILMIFVFMLSLSGCRRVAVTMGDELVMNDWSATTKSGMRADLYFEESSAYLTLYDSQGKELSSITGVYAVDSKSLYITDHYLCKTFSFGYKVFTNRAELEYLGETIIFYPLSEQNSTEVSSSKTE